MKLATALHAVTRVLLDTSPVIYYIEKNPQYLPLVNEVFHRLDTGILQAVTTPITLAECLVVPCRQGLVPLQQDFVDLVTSGPGVAFVLPDAAIARQAADLRARYRLSLTDAFQVATALAAGCNALLTNDLGLKRVTELPILVLDELEV